MPPFCMRLHARGGDEEGVRWHVLNPVAVCRRRALRERGG
jgi:hypothetical protein